MILMTKYFQNNFKKHTKKMNQTKQGQGNFDNILSVESSGNNIFQKSKIVSTTEKINFCHFSLLFILGFSIWHFFLFGIFSIILFIIIVFTFFVIVNTILFCFQRINPIKNKTKITKW